MSETTIFKEYKSYCINFQPSYIKNYYGIVVKDDLIPVKDVISMDENCFYGSTLNIGVR